ncbi:MAG: VWA domain-containing protein [Pyrinomonadaceae bacterium]
MRRSYNMLVLTVLALAVSLPALAQECQKSFRITGTGVDGQQKDFVMALRRPLREAPSFDPAISEVSDEKYYRGYYQVVPNSATFKQNCAGLVMDRHWRTGNTYFPASTFFADIVQRFARVVSSGFQAGDIVVFGSANHVAHVVGPGSMGSRAIIESKDNEESIVRGELYLSGASKDPIKQKNGAPTIYRLVGPVSVTEVSYGECDVADLTVTIDVNETLRGELRPLAGATVTLRLNNGETINAPLTDGQGKTAVVISNTPQGRVAIARAGLGVKVTLKGFENKSDTIPASFLTGADAIWNMTMTRTADNPADADPNIPPGTGGISLEEWEKRLKAFTDRLAAAEAKKAEFVKKQSSLKNNVQAVEKAETESRRLIAELKKLKPAVDRVEQYCKDAAKAGQQLDAIAKTVRDKEKEATTLTDELVALTDKCSSADDVRRIREGTTRLQQLIKDLADPVKEARKQNDELKRLQAESQKEMLEILKAVDMVKSVKEQEDKVNQAFKDAMKDYDVMSTLEREISDLSFALFGDYLKLRREHPSSTIPPATDKQLEALNVRVEALRTGASAGMAPVEIANKIPTVAALTTEASTIVSQYRSALCLIKSRDDVLDDIVGSVTFAGLGLQTLLNSESKIKQCEERLDCASQIKKINEALDIGDLEGATSIIAAVKPLCDTSAVEKRWTEISTRISFDLGTARNKWRDIASSCDYRGAYDAAIVIQRQYPRHPWIVKNLPDIERGYRAEEQIRALVEKLVVEDRARNYDEAERILAQIDGIAAPFPCMIAETKKLRGEYGRGKPVSPETERLCRQLLNEIRAAIAAKRLVEASQKLKQAQQDCANVSPALFTDLGAAQTELDRAIQQAINDVSANAGKCEFEAAYRLAEQVRQVSPGAFTAEFVERLRQQAEAQREARQFLEPGLEAIKQKDVKGAVSSLRRASGVRNLPQCIADNVNKLLKELEKRQSFTELTEQVQRATERCDYKEAAVLLSQIKAIAPREDYIIDWLKTNDPILADLQMRERNALDWIRQAEALHAKAESASTTDPVDWNSVSLTVKQAMDLLVKANDEAPKCMSRQNMEAIRQRLNAIATRKKPEIAASIALLIDTSGSMADNNKIFQAKEAARRAARQVSKTTEIAILHFDGSCGGGAMRVAAAFTTDVNVLLAAIDGLRPGGGTPMYVSTAEAVDYAQKNGRGKQRTVVLMSDGGDSCRDEQAKAAASIRSSNIPVSTIGFDVGNNQQAQGDLGNLAKMTGGRTFSASAADPREIIRAFSLAMLPSLLKDLDFGAAGSSLGGYFTQAKTMVQQQNISGALMMLQQANQIAPSSPNLNFNLSLVYEADDQLIPAVTHANNYLRLAPQAVDRADVENRIGEIQQELQRNPRVVMDSSGCRDVLAWSQTEREAAKRAKDTSRMQAILEILIASQRGDCEKARPMAETYKSRYR